MMANRVIEKGSIKRIFENMEYDKEAKEGWALALAWFKKHNNKFYSSPDIEIESVQIYSDVCERTEITIEVNKINDQNIKQLIQECETGLKGWKKLNGIKKAKLFNKLPSEIEKYNSLISQLEMKNRNLFTKDTKKLSIPMLCEYFQYYAGWASQIGTKILDYEPYGICVVSLDQTTPLALIGMIIAPCLAAGNVLILNAEKELIPICFLIKELCNNVGFPRDVIKIVNGDLQCVLKHESIHKLTYVGDLFDIKFGTLEIKDTLDFNSLHLGKTTMIVFDSADLDSACDSVIDMAMGYRGYYPWAVNTVYIQETVASHFYEKFKSKYESIGIAVSACYSNGDVLKDTEPKIVFGYKEAGSNILLNNKEKILNILPFRTANESVALTNNTRLGLAVSIWTENISLANEIASKLKTSTVWINTHGDMDAACTFSPYKKSGKGYYGGKEGFFEYLQYTNKMILPIETNCVQNKTPYLYYGGSFKKSESGIIFNEFEISNKKDVRNIVEVALKAHDGWKKLKPKNRGQCLRKLADNCSSIKISGNIIDNFIESLYEWATISISMLSLNLGSPAITSVKEPLGVIVIEVYSNIVTTCLKIITAAISCGNSVIIINKLDNDDFLREICTKCSLPAGVFNVINNVNDEVINTIKTHQEVLAYFTVKENTMIDISSQHIMYDMSYINIDNTESIFTAVTKPKCVWTSFGESFL